MGKNIKFKSQSLIETFSLLISTIVIVNYLFGYFLLADILYKYEVTTELKYIGSLNLLFLNFTNIICGLFYVLYSKKLDVNPKIWLMFGLVYGNLSLILLIVSKIEGENVWSFFKTYKYLLSVIVSAYIIEQIFRIVVFKSIQDHFTDTAQNIFHLMNSEVSAMKKITFFLSNIGVSLWCFNLAKRYEIKSGIWVFIALVLGIISPIILSVYGFIQKNK